MADGDAASAIGLAILTGLEKVKDMWKQVNATRDMIANHITSGTHPASAITTGTIDGARIPDLDAAKITTGVFDDAQIPDLDAAKITTGRLSDARMPSSVESNGPSDSAYARTATGSGWFAVWMNSSNQWMRNTSSKRYKTNIRDWIGTTLGLRPVIFDRKGADTPNDEVGFIAEEVLKTLPEAVVYFDGQVDGITDRAIIAALVSDVNRLTARVAELEKKGD